MDIAGGKPKGLKRTSIIEGNLTNAVIGGNTGVHLPSNKEVHSSTPHEDPILDRRTTARHTEEGERRQRRAKGSTEVVNTTTSNTSDEVSVQPSSNERGTGDEGTEIGVQEREEVQKEATNGNTEGNVYWC